MNAKEVQARKIEKLLEELDSKVCSRHQDPDPDCHICYPRDQVSHGWMILAKIYEERMLKANQLLSSPQKVEAHLVKCSRTSIHEEYMEKLGLGKPKKNE